MSPMHYEHRRQPPLTERQFALRIARHGGFAVLLVAGSVVVGTAGYHWIAGFEWIDALLDACMILGGMGPVGSLHSTAGKLFASAFALYAGLLFLVCAAVLITPVLHRVFHKFHWEADQAARRARPVRRSRRI